MKRQFLLYFLFTVSYFSFGQVSFRTVAPQDPVVAGDSFEIQYIVDGKESVENFLAPSFNGFRLVTGPHVYKGSVIDLNVARPLVNTVYTLAAVKPGRYVIHGAKAIIGTTELNSNDVFIEVISKEEAFKRNKRKDGSFFSNSEYFLRPGEDPVKKIQQNLFLKVSVDKRSCYVGEPVTATFKLYSRLESKSDIVKNPGFYGFAVHDMINLADKRKKTELLNGKTFDVHTIREVQLYPLQPGKFSIDPMEISNKVEFSRSEVNRKTEQEIAEGVLAPDYNENFHTNTEVYENTMKTEAIAVSVKPLPAKSKTDSFTAAVGKFIIHAELKKDEIAKNEQDSMIISVSGEGNFTQITAPVITWPAGIEVFEPVIQDSINRLTIPLSGTKTFRYTFVSDKPGAYELPAVSFPFFNPQTEKFETVSTQPLKLQVSYKEKVKDKIAEAKKTSKGFHLNYWRLAGIAVLGLIVIILFLVTSKRKTKISEPVITQIEQRPSVESFLQPAQMMLVADDSRFYNELSRSIWNYFGNKTKFAGSEMNKNRLNDFLKGANVEQQAINDLMRVLQLCEAGIYTTVVYTEDKSEVLETVRTILLRIDSKLT